MFDLQTRIRKGGFFLTAGKKPNPMTIGWGQLGVMWRKDVFIVPVRDCRFTHSLLEEDMEFTVSIPYEGEMSEGLKIAGTLSGKDCDKWKEGKLTPVKAKSVNTAIVDGCEYYYECKVIAKFDTTADLIDKEITDFWYKNGGYHTLYVGEIKEFYKN